MLQGSTNLTQWTNVFNVTAGTNGTAQFTFTNSSHSIRQFFRLKATLAP